MYNTNICKLYILSNKFRDVGSTLKGGGRQEQEDENMSCSLKLRLWVGEISGGIWSQVWTKFVLILFLETQTFTKIYSTNGISIKKWHQDIDELDELLAY